MCSFPKTVTISLGILLVYSSCSHSVFQRNRVYQAPRMGAESRFDEGLRREKHPQHLFSKKERRDMEKMGTLSQEKRAAPNTRISAARADSIANGLAPADSTQTTADSTRLPMDSAQAPPPDTAR
ncbi:hypothetical protein [Chitinophaga japonensis]|uniref:Uncharacterized protein n=1 Tax=Chitinophaga japonensis TaxID=104662 RepID=A0A562T0M1_CHIJA|nr:hypothetical protein [Chitinophaga japonensis]TWI86626.1 hypothetical protein LX66_3888 [Chitinophaga japonensis]